MLHVSLGSNPPPAMQSSPPGFSLYTFFGNREFQLPNLILAILGGGIDPKDTPPQLSHEKRKKHQKTSYFPSCWLFNLIGIPF